jgi:MarR family transcriptional regulator for hemolysin
MASKSVRAFAEQQMADVGSNLSVAIITRILSEQPELSQRELAAKMGVEGPTMARHMDRLESGGVITRSRDERDRRVLRVRLTTDGKRLQRRLAAQSARTDHILTSGFQPDELVQFEQFLDRIRQHARELVEHQKGTTA